jgi:hypothetical protein
VISITGSSLMSSQSLLAINTNLVVRSQGQTKIDRKIKWFLQGLIVPILGKIKSVGKESIVQNPILDPDLFLFET